MLHNDKMRRYLLFICVFLFLVFVMWCSPFTSDDYEFAAQKFENTEDFMSYVLYYGNGRLLGNISALAMVNFPGAACIFKALVLASVIFLLPEVLGLKSAAASAVSVILLLGINADVFGEVYTWTSGFGNYLPPIWLTLLNLYLIDQYPKAKHGAVKALLIPAVFVLGVASQLFVEHSTLVNILLAGVLVLREMRSQGKERAAICWVWLAATLVGAAVMFAIPKVFYLENNRSTGYRSFHLGSILAILFSAAKNVMRLGVGYLGTMGAVMCLGGLLTVYLTRESRTDKWNSWFYGICAVSLIYQLISCVTSAESWYGQLTVVHHAVSTVMVIPPFFVWAAAALKLRSKDLRNTVLCLLGLALVSLGVLLVVSPVPARVVYQSYIFIAGAVLVLAEKAAEALPEEKKAILIKGLCIVMAVLILVLGCVFLNIHNLSQMRQQHIANVMELGLESIEFFRIPYDYVFWENDLGFKYHYYYEEPGDFRFIVLDFDTWCSKYLRSIVVQ